MFRLSRTTSSSTSSESESPSHRGADLVADAEVEAALLVHGVVDAGQLGQLRPVVLEGVVQQAVVGAAGEGGQKVNGLQRRSTGPPPIRGLMNQDSPDVSLQLLAAAHGPVVPVEGRLHQRRHHAAHRRLVPAAVALAVVLHAQPVARETPVRRSQSAGEGGVGPNGLKSGRSSPVSGGTSRGV